MRMKKAPQLCKLEDKVVVAMTQDTTTCISEAGGGSPDRMAGRFWNRLCRWVFLYVWCRHCYRPVMRLLHRFNLHYAPPMPRMHGDQPNFCIHHWCQWCGLRGTTVDINSVAIQLSQLEAKKAARQREREGNFLKGSDGNLVYSPR